MMYYCFCSLVKLVLLLALFSSRSDLHKLAIKSQSIPCGILTFLFHKNILCSIWNNFCPSIFFGTLFTGTCLQQLIIGPFKVVDCPGSLESNDTVQLSRQLNVCCGWSPYLKRDTFLADLPFSSV